MGYTFDKGKPGEKNKTPAARSDISKEQALPNSLVMRIMEDPQAENEAEKLSRGVSSTTPEEVMREMGGRLGADFSDVQFHSDPLSMNRSRAMGARAWAQGSDVYFGKGGFDPKVAAHELVHTVQQGAVRGNVSESMPMGAVQLLPDKDKTEIKPDYSLKEADVQQTLTQIFNTDMGSRVFRRFEGTLKDMIKKGAGRNFPYTKAKGIEFLSLAYGKDYSSKGILSTIMQKDITEKVDAKDAAYEYETYIDLLSKRLGNYGLEDVAIRTGLINRPPRYEHANNESKRAYETDMPDEEENAKVFNPNNIPELTKIQEEIDGARDAESAYSIFAAYGGNPEGEYTDNFGTDLDVSIFKKKLKHMARVIYDYPELRGNIGDMKTKAPGSQALMSTVGGAGGIYKIDFGYNAHFDRKGEKAEKKRKKVLASSRKDNSYNSPSLDFMGTHEMGHGVVSLLPDTGATYSNIEEGGSGFHEDDIIKTVIKNTDVLTEEEKQNIKYYDKDQTIHGNIDVLKGQIDPEGSKLYENNHTSEYGAYSPQEFFAESFHDIYSNGKNAKPMSKEVVKEYEKRQRKLTEKKFKKKAKRGIFRWLTDLFRF